MTARSGEGSSLGTVDYNLGPYEVRQFSFNGAFRSVSSQNVRLEVALLSGDGKVVAFGSGLANQTSDPSTFEMTFAGDLLADNALMMTSSAFTHSSSIPTQHTCDGQDVSPALQWTNAPAGTQSFAIILDDPDAPSATWTH